MSTFSQIAALQSRMKMIREVALKDFDWTQHERDHPAKFTKEIINILTYILRQYMTNPIVAASGHKILDPFAGTGMIHQLREYGYLTIGSEIELEWAARSDYTLPYDSLKLEEVFPHEFFQGVVTSPTYGNRMADSHTPGPCSFCNGEGSLYTIDAKTTCPKCKGTGRESSKRITYTHKLGRKLTENNSGAMQWGIKYRSFHIKMWELMYKLVEPGGIFVLNIKDHIRVDMPMLVSKWHKDVLQEIGFDWIDWYMIDSPGMRFGENSGSRFAYEHILVFKKSIPMASAAVAPRFPVFTDKFKTQFLTDRPWPQQTDDPEGW